MLVKCVGPNCGKVFEAPEGSSSECFCSIECACYAGRFSVTKGWHRPTWACSCWGEGHDWVACDECRIAYELWMERWLGEVE